MTLDAKSPARPVRTVATARLARLRRGSLAVLVLVVVEYGIGMYVNFYVSIPRADRGHGVGSAISNGPAMLSIHAAIGLLLGLGALSVLVQAVMARHLGAIVSVAGASFTSSGNMADSMSMSVLTGVGLLCYAANLYLLRPPSGRT